MVTLSRARAAAWLKENEEDPRSTRRLDLNWFTAGNYMRVFAAIIMKGLINVVDDPELFHGFANGKFKRTGATEVVGLTLNQYQQLLRFMTLVDEKKKRSPSHDQLDKLFKV